LKKKTAGSLTTGLFTGFYKTGILNVHVWGSESVKTVKYATSMRAICLYCKIVGFDDTRISNSREKGG
jgi:hypothetical protein